MSTSQASLPSWWKQEVNRRVAEHKNRKGAEASEEELHAVPRRASSRRGAEAAARVAERFAKAPSYNEMVAEEAQDAETHIPRARHHAQAATEPMFAGFEAVPDWEPQAAAALAVEQDEVLEPVVFHPQTEPSHIEEPVPIRSEAGAETDQVLQFGEDAGAVYRIETAEESEAAVAEEMEAVDPAQGAHANLIEFPRELVATRRARPRLVEGPYAAERSSQLSIFEVDPGTVATDAELTSADVAPAWNAPEWSGIELDAQPVEELDEEEMPDFATAEAPALELAPMSRRLLAVAMDVTLVSAAVLAGGVVVAANVGGLPGPRLVEISAGVAFVGLTVLYQVLFFTFARATPGMKYAHLELCTFGNERPTLAQRWRRLAALPLSVLPVGLGLVWALFDEDRMSWHDRLSQTYLRLY